MRTLADGTPPPWLAYSGSRINLLVRRRGSREVLLVLGNPQGLASLVAHFLWLTACSDNGSFSVTALPFVFSTGPLAFSVVMELARVEHQGRLVRHDKGYQFEWQVHDEDLDVVLKAVHNIAMNGHVPWFDVGLSPESD